MRETWFLKNIHTRELTIADLDKAPAIRSNETVDLLRYHTKQEIEQSESLQDAINLGYVKLIKKRDGVRTVKETPDDINLSIENAEIAESVRYWGEMYVDETGSTSAITSIDEYVEVNGTLLGGSTNGLVFQNGKELRVIIPGTYSVHWAMSIKSSASGHEISGAVTKNGVKQDNGTSDAITAAANKNEAVGSNMILPHLVAGDLIGLAVANHTATVDIFVEHISCVALRIGN